MVIIALVFIWVLSVAMALPGVIFSHVTTFFVGYQAIKADNGTVIGYFRRNISVCIPFPAEFGPNYAKIIILTRVITQYCLPLLIIGTFYAIMAHHLLRRFDYRQCLFVYFNRLTRPFVVVPASRQSPAKRRWQRRQYIAEIRHKDHQRFVFLDSKTFLIQLAPFYYNSIISMRRGRDATNWLLYSVQPTQVICFYWLVDSEEWPSRAKLCKEWEKDKNNKK